MRIHHLLALLGTFAAAMLPVQAATVYTGDATQGKRVIRELDVNELDPGKKHSFYFQGVQMGTGQHWYLPVVVSNGAKPGKHGLLISGVHGDEVSPVDAVQRNAMVEPGTRVVQVLYDSPDSKCDGDGCGEEGSDHVE